MSVCCNLIEISPNLLELFKAYPEARHLYYRASSSRHRSSIDSISNLSIPHQEIVREIYPGDRHKIGKIINLDDCESVLSFRKYFPEDYFLIKDNISTIIEQGKTALRLDLGREWELVSFLFGGSFNPNTSDLVIWSKSNFGLNPILFRKHSLGIEDPEHYYIKVDEVKILVDLMQESGDEIMYENLRHVSARWKYISCLLCVKDLYASVKDFYMNIAERENVVLINIS
jgi:hypothetical protein